MQTANEPSVLPYEWHIYQLLEGYQAIPRIHWIGMDGGAHVMVMDKLGPDLGHLRRFCRGSFSLKTVLMLAEQLVSRPSFIFEIHSHGIYSFLVLNLFIQKA